MTMKKILSAMALVAVVGVSAGFDAHWPPAEKTLVSTAKSVSNVVLPSVHFDQTSLRDALAFLSQPDIPRGYATTVSGEALGDEVLDTLIDFKAKDIKLLAAVAEVAEMVDAQIVIRKGVLLLQPSATGNGSTQSDGSEHGIKGEDPGDSDRGGGGDSSIPKFD